MRETPITSRDQWLELRGVVLIPLTRGHSAIIDKEDANIISCRKWFAAPGRNTFYAHRSGWNGIRPFTIRMHRLILGAPDGVFVDHINGDGLDNRRSNLRLCSHGQNIRNQSVRAHSSKYKGVSYNKRLGKWTAHICLDYKLRRLGCFESEEEAAAAYDLAAISVFGEFARTNSGDFSS